MIEKSYELIWDCCCDHGLLGMTLLKRQASDRVVFVDILEKQMLELEQKLTRFFPKDDYDWQVKCQDMKKIAIPKKESQLFIIAGVGSDKTIEFFKSLCETKDRLDFDLIVCSVHGNYHVRKALRSQGFFLIQEEIVKENNRFYEIIYASPNAEQTISSTGNTMWDRDNLEHVDYWQKTVEHYRKKAKTNPHVYQPILSDYEQLPISD